MVKTMEKREKKGKKLTTKTKEGICPSLKKLGKLIDGGKMGNLIGEKKIGKIISNSMVNSIKRAPVAQPITSRAKPPTAYIGRDIIKGPFPKKAIPKLLRSLSWNALICQLLGSEHSRPMEILINESMDEAYYKTENISQSNERNSEKIEILGNSENGTVERDFIERNKIGVFKLSECSDRVFVKSKFEILLKGWIIQYLIGQGDAGAHNIIYNTEMEMVFIDFDDTRNTYDYQADDLFKLLFHRPIGLFRKEYTNWLQGNTELKKKIQKWVKEDVLELIESESGILNDLENEYLYSYNRERIKMRYGVLEKILNK